MVDAGLANLLAELKLEGLGGRLEAHTLGGLADSLKGGRPAFLSMLKEAGVDKLAERQALSNGLSKAVREGRLGQLSGAPPPRLLFLHGFGNSATIAELQTMALKAEVCDDVKILEGTVVLAEEQLRTAAGLDADLRKEGLAGTMTLHGWYPVEVVGGLNHPRSFADVSAAAGAIAELIVSAGGYDGIVGFSQGASTALVVAERVAEINERLAPPARRLRFVAGLAVGRNAAVMYRKRAEEAGGGGGAVGGSGAAEGGGGGAAAESGGPAAGSLAGLSLVLAAGGADELSDQPTLEKIGEQARAAGAVVEVRRYPGGHVLPTAGDQTYAAIKALANSV